MRKTLSLLMAIVIVLGLAASGHCSAEGTLFLKVAKITFSYVGESEYIYAGTVPLDEVTWRSDDPSIVSVKDGVLTAEGVGTTTVRAIYAGQSVECEAGCLTSSYSRLMETYSTEVHQPKRIAPEVEFDAADFFSDAVMIGDSVTAVMNPYETATGLLGHPLFLARKNLGVNNFVNHILNLYYRGQEMYVEDAIAKCKAKKVFFLLGMNDFGYQTASEVAEKYRTLIERVQKKSPNVEIYIQTCLPFYSGSNYFSGQNEEIDRFNAMMVPIAEETGCHIVDVAAYIESHINGMASPYCADFEIHMNEEGCIAWMNVLRAYAWEQMLKAQDLSE